MSDVPTTVPVEFETLVRFVDGVIHRDPSDREAPAMLFAVVAESAEEFSVEVLAVGDRYEVCAGIVLPARALALGMSVCGWAAPMAERGEPFVRPSQHPKRYRIHQTILIDDLHDGAVLRAGNGEPQYLEGANGIVYDLMVDCWERKERREPRGAA